MKPLRTFVRVLEIMQAAMDKMRCSFLAVLLLALSKGSGLAQEHWIREDFRTDPAERGWVAVGAEELFGWQAEQERLHVSWDTEKPNSYYAWPLGQVLTRETDFRMEFDLVLTQLDLDFQPGYAFEIAVGLVNLRQAAQFSFFRGSGRDSPNLVEFDYFPDTGFGATVSPAIISSNSVFATSFTFPLELVIGSTYRVEMDYEASEARLNTTLICDGEPVDPPVKSVTLPETFTDFRVDTFAVNSYSDRSDRGRIRAVGWIDNVALQLPVRTGFRLRSEKLSMDGFRVSLPAPSPWTYQWETSRDLVEWATVGETVRGEGQMMEWTSPDDFKVDNLFFRVRRDLILNE